MNNLNSVLIEGNLTRDPEAKAIGGDKQLCSFSVACNRRYKKAGEYAEEVSYVDIETWGTLAATCAEHLEKGRGVRVVGRLKQDRWQDHDGSPRSKVKVVAESVEFRGKKKAADEAIEVPTKERELAHSF